LASVRGLIVVMDRTKEILTELQEIAPALAEGSGISMIPYHVPAGYFDNFAGILMNRIHLESAGLSEPPEAEISGISGLLAGLQKKNPYRVPEGYFETFKTDIPSEKIPSKLVVMTSTSTADSIHSPKKRVTLSPIRMVRYAVAACIVGLIGLSVFDLTYHRNLDPINELRSVSEQEMANFMDSDDIHWTPGVSASITSAVEFSDNEIHDLFSSVPDDELEQYASAMPEEKQTVN
jgi:hypothetical protein